MIEKTIEYDLFKKHPSNTRYEDKGFENHVRTLVASIKSKNLLEYRPILVDRDRRVLDGNHRLEAARRLQVPIYYQVEENAETSDIMKLNAAVKPWNPTNYLKYWASQGKQEYIRLSKFMERKNLTLVNALVLLGMSWGGHASGDFRSGEFKMPDSAAEIEAGITLDNVYRFVDYVREKSVGDKIYITRAGFLRALVVFLSTKSVDFELFMQKLPYRIDLLKPCSRIVNYLDIFKLIYNYKNKQPLEIDFNEYRTGNDV